MSIFSSLLWDLLVLFFMRRLACWSKSNIEYADPDLFSVFKYEGSEVMEPPLSWKERSCCRRWWILIVLLVSYLLPLIFCRIFLIIFIFCSIGLFDWYWSLWSETSVLSTPSSEYIEVSRFVEISLLGPDLKLWSILEWIVSPWCIEFFLSKYIKRYK